MTKYACILTIMLTCALVTAQAVPPSEAPKANENKIDFEKQVQPIFASHCVSCHGEKKQKSGYRLDSRSSALGVADFGVASIIPGNSKQSALVQLVSGTHADGVTMPKGDGRRLSKAEIRTLSQWIDQGAAWPDHLAGKTVETPGVNHWAFQPVAAVTPPKTTSAWPSNAIDAFVLEKLDDAGLQPSKTADRATILRRIYLSMHGLPPTPEQSTRFLNDPRPDAYDRLVEEVLASPRYGERWAQHWLDVVRYADTHGFEVNTPRDNAWPYRDYVIRAINEDRPYDQFIAEQLAGDQLGEGAATGFLVTSAVLLPGQIGKDEDSKKLARQDELDEIVANIGSAFMGLTVSCARCHNHKFDPISQKDYYSMQAIFSGVQFGDRLVDPPGHNKKKRESLKAELTKLKTDLAKLTKLRPAVSALKNVESFDPIEAQYVRFTTNATSHNNQYAPCIDELEIFAADGSGDSKRNVALATSGATATDSGTYQNGVSSSHKLEHVNDGKYGNGRSWISNEVGRGWVQIKFAKPERVNRIEWARDRLGGYADRLPVDYKIEVAMTPGEWHEVASSADRLPQKLDLLDPKSLAPFLKTDDAKKESEKIIAKISERTKAYEATPATRKVYAGVFGKPEPSFRLRRGNPNQPLEPVAPDAITRIGSLNLGLDAPEPERRKALADWLTNKENPLTARVIVNRVWHHHFGNGIVDTPSDFGAMGGKPSHLELLDWLASDFMANGWSLKRLHRLILHSNTWQQSSQPNAESLRKDSDSRLLWRFPPRRLEGEAIRDSVLATSGVLDLKMGGPGFSLFKKGQSGVAGYTAKETFDAKDWRRMIYTYKVRMEKDSVFCALDIPDGGRSCSKRDSSTTPIQALNLFNSTFMIQQSEIFAKRIRKDAGEQPHKQVQLIFQEALLRQPNANELDAAVRTINDHGLETLCRVMFNTNEFLFIP